MKEKPILFSGPMVKAILEGRKTQTRRVVKGAHGRCYFSVDGAHCRTPSGEIQNRYGAPGDRLWVREAFRHCDFEFIGDAYSCATQYRADMAFGDRKRGGMELMHERIGWRPSIHMPRKASRLTLEIVSVRVERLQEIDRDDALAEGIRRISHGRSGDYFHAFNTDYSPDNWSCATDAFKELWQSINGAESWNANPWVWCIEFRRL